MGGPTKADDGMGLPTVTPLSTDLAEGFTDFQSHVYEKYSVMKMNKKTKKMEQTMNR